MPNLSFVLRDLLYFENHRCTFERTSSLVLFDKYVTPMREAAYGKNSCEFVCQRATRSRNFVLREERVDTASQSISNSYDRRSFHRLSAMTSLTAAARTSNNTMPLLA